MPKEKEKTKLEHLRLIVTNKCNLNCIYCYANGGSYNQKISEMSLETAINSINYFYYKFNWIHQISFFGGEPLIKIDLIKELCEYILSFCKENNKKPPIFSIVTNGVLLDKKAINIINKYNIYTNISLDGPKDFNDQQRKFVDHNESVFEFVDQNAKNLRKKRKFSIESTCTNIINNFDYNFEYIQNYFRNRYSIERVNVVPAMIVNEVNKDLELAGDKKNEKKLSLIIERFFDESNEHFVFNDIIIRLLNTYFTDYYCSSFCDAGITQFTISMNGDIYPCQLFLSNKENKLGNVNLHNYELIDSFKNKSLKEFPKCKECGYKRFCQTCLYNIKMVETNDEYCQEVKKGVQVFLQNIFNLKVNNNSRYCKLLEEYKNFYANAS